MTIEVDVLCAGLACYDLIFGVERHPAPDEKMFADRFFDCGGGPAADAAVAAAGLAAGMPWGRLLDFASAAAALCCRCDGARLGMRPAPMCANFY